MRKFLFFILTFPLLAQTPTERVGQINTGCLDAGSTDAYACNLPLPAPVAYVTGAIYSFRANTSNTGAASINFSSLGAKTIVKVAGGITTALADNDIRAGQVVVLSYDGTNMEMQSTLGNAGGGGGTPIGADKTLQYNDSGAFGGASGTSWTDATRNLNILDANSNYMFIFTTDPTGDPHCNAVFNIGCDPVRPPSVGTTPGTGAGVIELDGVPGGNTSIVTTGVGGRGGQNILWSGAGGIAPAAATASTGGDGGPLHINGGPGGAADDAANLGINVGGHGADLTFAAGIGGAASHGSSNTGGRGGNITLQPGTGGNGSTVNGAIGKIILPTLAGGGDQFVTVDNSGNVGAPPASQLYFDPTYLRLGVNGASKLGALTGQATASFTIGNCTTLANGDSDIVATGAGCLFTRQMSVGTRITLSSDPTTFCTVSAITSDTEVMLDSNFWGDACGDGTSQTITVYPSPFNLKISSGRSLFATNDLGQIALGFNDSSNNNTPATTQPDAFFFINQWLTSDMGHGVQLLFEGSAPAISGMAVQARQEDTSSPAEVVGIEIASLYTNVGGMAKGALIDGLISHAESFSPHGASEIRSLDADVVASVGGTVDLASGVYIRSPSLFSSALITTQIGLNIQDQAGSGITTAYAIKAGSGKIELDDLKTTGTATGKNVVCVDTATGILYASSAGTGCLN